MSLSVVTFKWDKPGYRSKFTSEHVNTLYSMIKRNYPHPFTLTCITDNPAGIDSRIRVLPLWDTFAAVPSPHRGNNPSCFRRLRLWSTEMRDLIGPRILQIDLDMVICADPSPLWNRREDIVLWADKLNPTTPYNGAMQLFTAGTRPDVYETFDPSTSPKLANSHGYWGTDQAWISYVLGPGEARWTQADGALSWRVHCKMYAQFPPQARIVNFHGAEDPWTVANRIPCVSEHYR